MWLARCGFTIPTTQTFVDEDLLIIDGDELAHMLGRLSMATIFASAARQFWMLSWPVTFVLLLSDKPPLVKQTLVQAKAAYDVFLKLTAKDGREAFEGEVLGRSLFNLTSVMQVIHAWRGGVGLEGPAHTCMFSI